MAYISYYIYRKNSTFRKGKFITYFKYKIINCFYIINIIYEFL